MEFEQLIIIGIGELMENLYSTKGVVYLKMCKLFIGLGIGEKVESISNLAKIYDVGRGTIQDVIKELEDTHAIELKKQGRNGTILVAKNNKLLLTASSIDCFFGVMPLPYTFRYEALATAVKSEIRSQTDTIVSMSYVKNAEDRIRLVKEGRVDFGIFSEEHGRQIISENDELEILIVLHDCSYLSKHVIASNNPQIKKVGLDANSYVHRVLTEQNFNGYEYVQLHYNQINEQLQNGKIDAAIINNDDIKNEHFRYQELSENPEFLRAAIVVNKSNQILANILDIGDFIENVELIQNAVLTKELDPNY